MEAALLRLGSSAANTSTANTKSEPNSMLGVLIHEYKQNPRCLFQGC